MIMVTSCRTPNENKGIVGADTSFDVLLKCVDANKEDTSLC